MGAIHTDSAPFPDPLGLPYLALTHFGFHLQREREKTEEVREMTSFSGMGDGEGRGMDIGGEGEEDPKVSRRSATFGAPFFHMWCLS